MEEKPLSWLRLSPGAPSLRNQLKSVGLPERDLQRLDWEFRALSRVPKIRKLQTQALRESVAKAILNQLPL